MVFLGHKIRKNVALVCVSLVFVFLVLLFIGKDGNGKPVVGAKLVVDETGTAAAEDIYLRFLNGEGKTYATHLLDLGFFSGNAWLLLGESGDGNDGTVVDLGPEPIDRADLFAFDAVEKTWKIFDSCGRQVLNAEKKVITEQDSLRLPPPYMYSDFFLVRIRSFDFTSLCLRTFSEHDYSMRCLRFSQVQIALVTLMVSSLIFLVVSAWFFKNLLFGLLAGMNFCFLMYIVCMTGVGSTFLYNPLCQLSFTRALSYFFSGVGFTILLVFFMNFHGIIGKLYQIFLKVLLVLGVTASCLYLFVPSIKILTIVSLVAVVLGCSLIIFLNLRFLAKRKFEYLTLVGAWIPLFVYVILRQSVHIARFFMDAEFVGRIFENDYYFGYSLCFLVNITVYARSVFRAATKKTTKAQTLFKKFSLTEREIAVAELVLKHYTNQSIAETLYIDRSTVSSHVKNIYKKMGVTKRTEFVALVLE